MNNSPRVSSFVDDMIQLALLFVLPLMFLIFQNMIVGMKADRLILAFQYIFLHFIFAIVKKLLEFKKTYLKIIIILLFIDDIYRNFYFYFTKEFLHEIQFLQTPLELIHENLSIQGDIIEKYGYIKIFWCLAFPNLFLIFGTNIKMALFDLFIIKVEGGTFLILYFLIFRYNGIQRNPYAVVLYSVFALFEFLFFLKRNFFTHNVSDEDAFDNEEERSTRSLTFVENVLAFIFYDLEDENENTEIQENYNVISSIQNFFNLKQLNLNQLFQLKKEISSFLDRINNECDTRKETNLTLKSPILSQKCVICLESDPDITCSPCMHQCICSDCLNDIHTSNQTYHQCFICKLPIISWNQISKNYQKYITEDEYRYEGYLNTIEELRKLEEIKKKI
eukprot:gene5584-9400_t